MSKFFSAITGFVKKHRGLSIFIGILLLIVFVFLFIAAMPGRSQPIKLRCWLAAI